MSAFETLRNFSSVITQVEVSQRDGKIIDFHSGLERAVLEIQKIENTTKKVVLIGNGGSAAIASHQAVDLWKNGGIKATTFNDASLLTCISNDFSYEEVFSKPIEKFSDSGDLLIAISSSGKSKNILKGVWTGRKCHCSVITFSGFNVNNDLRRLGDLNFYLPSYSYGIVEVGHLLLIHSIIDEVIQRKNQPGSQHQSPIAVTM